ncbi:hypothetical protein VTL71DRAFT_2382 [Oculimacula yallundae]|uniref:Uncharacterized protein n=1 Tax=Oculimacula yallundae TaxID=86028 RepID=A0ABR4C8Q6_9HELO
MKTYRDRSGKPSADEEMQFDDDSDVYDEEGFSRTEIAMAMASEQIFEHGAAIHSTLKNRLSGTRFSDSSQEIPQHLQDFKWKAPPPSPTFSDSSLVPVLPRFEVKRIKYLERTLKNLDVAQLFKIDKGFHDLMWTLEGIREWWTANRMEWFKNRDKLHDRQVALNSLTTQMEAAKSSESWDLHLRLKNACTQERKTIQYNETWFPENKYLMKLVMVQFRRVQEDADKLDAIISHKVVARTWVAPNGFSFGTNPPDDSDMFKAKWYQQRGFRWWLVMAVGHLEHCLEENILQKEPRIEAFEEIKDERQELEAALERLKSEEQYDVDYARIIFDEPRQTVEPASSLDWRQQLGNLGHIEDPKVVLRKKETAAKQAALKQLSNDSHELEFNIYRADTIIERDSAIINLVRNVLDATKDNRESLLLSSEAFARGLYYICSAQGLGTKLSLEIDAIFDDDNLQDSDRRAIMKSFELHRDAKESRRSNELLFHTLKKAVLFQSDLKDAKDSMLYQLQILNRTLDLAKSLVRSRKTGKSARHTYPGRDSGLLETSTSAMTLQQPSIWGWGQVRTLEQPKSILARGSQDPNQDPGWFLRNFFVSPDVAPHFKRIEKITKDKFFDLANSFVRMDFFADEIDAFLIWCTYVGDLFTVSGNFVSAYRQGWETIDEMPIDENFPRAVEFAKPPGLDDVRSWLIRNQEKCKLVSADRNTTEARLLHMIHTKFPHGEIFTLQELQKILGWLDRSGLLYRYTSSRNRNGEAIIRRIDNGWGPIDIHQFYDPIFDLDRPLPYFQSLRSIIKREDVQAVLSKANESGPVNIEWAIYNVLQPYLQVKRLSGMANTIITRHRFHLYLRWCDQTGDGLDSSLRRDGRVFGGPK